MRISMVREMKETRQSQAYNWLLAKIKNRDYMAGTALKEEVLAKELGISATPVREALRRLEREGWVENTPYCGCFMKVYSEEEIRELIVMRESIDVAAVSFIIRNMTVDDLNGLEQVLAESYTLIKEFEAGLIKPEDFIPSSRSLDEKFHSRLIAISRSARLIGMSELWSFQIQSYAFQSCQVATYSDLTMDDRPRFFWVTEQHHAIYTAIRQKWEQAARELVSAHIKTISDGIIMKKSHLTNSKGRKNK